MQLSFWQWGKKKLGIVFWSLFIGSPLLTTSGISCCVCLPVSVAFDPKVDKTAVDVVGFSIIGMVLGTTITTTAIGATYLLYKIYHTQKALDKGVNAPAIAEIQELEEKFDL